jgi:hypothetical protein
MGQVEGRRLSYERINGEGVQTMTDKDERLVGRTGEEAS